jgi:hypothetical protein
MKFLFSLAVGLLFSLGAWAQGWVSSGGEIFQNGKNAWFVKSTTQVSYCLHMAPTHVSASAETISKAIADGFEYWKKEFVRSSTLNGSSHFEVATQTFVKVECSASPDIKFQFGYETLEPKQIEYLKDPTKYIGITVRTNYETARMRGKGFIYFASDSGPHGYVNRNGELIEKAWSHQQILKYAILHELGHIFGIPHLGSGLMSEVFLNQILNKNLAEKYESTPIESFLRPAEDLETCSVSAAALSWFGAPAGTKCIAIQSATPLTVWKVMAKKEPNDNPMQIGEFRSVSPNLADQRGRPVTLLELPEDQEVFSGEEAGFRSFMMGPFLIDMGMTGQYFPNTTRRPAPVYISMTPSSLSIQAAAVASRLEPVFIYNSPLSILLLMKPN